MGRLATSLRRQASATVSTTHGSYRVASMRVTGSRWRICSRDTRRTSARSVSQRVIARAVFAPALRDSCVLEGASPGFRVWSDRGTQGEPKTSKGSAQEPPVIDTFIASFGAMHGPQKRTSRVQERRSHRASPNPSCSQHHIWSTILSSGRTRHVQNAANSAARRPGCPGRVASRCNSERRHTKLEINR
jgi:hypothetical protein